MLRTLNDTKPWPMLTDMSFAFSDLTFRVVCQYMYDVKLFNIKGIELIIHKLNTTELKMLEKAISWKF